LNNGRAQVNQILKQRGFHNTEIQKNGINNLRKYGLSNQYQSILNQPYLTNINNKAKHASRFRLFQLLKNKGANTNTLTKLKLNDFDVPYNKTAEVGKKLKVMIAIIKTKEFNDDEKDALVDIIKQAPLSTVEKVSKGLSTEKFINTFRIYRKLNKNGRPKISKWENNKNKNSLPGRVKLGNIYYNYSVKTYKKNNNTNANLKNYHISGIKNRYPIYKLGAGKKNIAPVVSGMNNNYSKNNIYDLLKKYSNAKNAPTRLALNKAIDLKLESEINVLRFKNVPYRITQYGEILRALRTRNNFPARKKIVGSIRNDLRKAANKSNAKYEINRLRQYLQLPNLPIRDRNIRKSFNDELARIKNRERRYESAYNGESRRRYNVGPPPLPPRYNLGPPRYSMGGFNAGPPPPMPMAGPMPVAGMGPGPAPRFNITGGATPPRINLPPVNIGAGPAPPAALPVNLPTNEAAAIKQVGGVNAAANKINQAGGATNVAKTANALQKAEGNQGRAVAEFGADPGAMKLVIQIAGPTKNYNRVNNLLNGMNKVATKIRRKKRAVTTHRKKRVVTTPHRKKRVVTTPHRKKRVVTTPHRKKRVVTTRRKYTKRTSEFVRVRTGELNKLLQAVTKNTIEHRMNNANLLKKVYTKAELARMYRNYILAKNLKK
jgi:hypothetical protein